MKKHLKANQRQEKGKRISAREIVDLPPEQESPLFSLRYMNKDYSLSQCTKDEKAAFADTLYKLNQLTWSEINASVTDWATRRYPEVPLEHLFPAILRMM